MRKEGGFTLIELTVVVMIIAVLVVSGLFGLLKLRHKAEDSNARTLARDAAVAERGMVTESGAFSSDIAGVLVPFEPGISWAAGGSTPGTVVVRTATDVEVDDVVCLSSPSESGNWFLVWMHKGDVTSYGVDTAADSLSTCPSTEPATAGTATWSRGGW